MRAPGRKRGVRLQFPLTDEAVQERVEALEDRLNEEGYEFDTGYSLSPPVREWELDETFSGPTSREALIKRVRAEGLKFTIAAQPKAPRSRVRYRVGDVLRIPLPGTRLHGYGRVLEKEKGSFLLEVFPVASKTDPSLGELAQRDWLLRFFCDDSGITRTKTWRIIGNIPVGELKHPVWWARWAGDGELYLFEDWMEPEPRRPTTQEEIRRLRAQEFGLAGYRYAENVMARELRAVGVLP